MSIRMNSPCSAATTLARFSPILLLLFLIGCGGSSSNGNNHPIGGAPAITSLSPASGVVGTSVTISGINFGSSQGSSTVTFNGTPASVATWSADGTTIATTVPASATTGNVVVTVNGTASNGFTFTVVPLQAGSIAASNFGMQCGIGTNVDGHVDCKGSGSTPINWPTAGLNPPAAPGLLRLHDSGTYWSALQPQSGPCSSSCDFTTLDNWLDLIAQHQPIAVSQVFTWVPCWDTIGGNETGPYGGTNNPGCDIDPVAPTGSNYPPTDLGSSGSATFNDFVTNFVQHCSPAGNCVGKCPSGQTCASTNLIQYYEMWNEWDISYHWNQGAAPPNGCGTTIAACAQLLYQMVAPAAAIVKANVDGSVILTPSTTPDSPTYQCDLLNWLNLEDTNGHISDWIAWHSYLTTLSGSTTVIPEQQWANWNQNFLNVQAGGSVAGCGFPATSNWTSTPWANTETNFSGSATVNYQCPQPTYSADDCSGQIVRWQILHDSIGTNGPNNAASGLFWYYWLNTIGSNSQYETAYYYMMQYMVGTKFTAPASSPDSITWTAPLLEADGATQAEWVWTTNESGVSYTVPSGYVDYRDLQGNTTNVTAGSQITIGVEPFLLEQ